MQSLQDLHLFDDDQNFQKQKEESINELIKDPYIMKVLSDFKKICKNVKIVGGFINVIKFLKE